TSERSKSLLYCGLGGAPYSAELDSLHSSGLKTPRSRLMFGVRAPDERSLGEHSVIPQLLTQTDLSRVVAGDRQRLDRVEELNASTRFPAVGSRQPGQEIRLLL